MASRYWRGGTGIWSAAGTNNWASSSAEATFTASRATTTLTVTAVASGTIAVGQTIWHTNGTAVGTIIAFLTGTGGVGTYTTSLAGTLTSRTMSSATIGASVPTISDDVIFDTYSNVGTAAFTVTITSGGSNCRDFSVSGLDGAMTWAGASTLNIGGSLTLPATNLTRTYTGAITFGAPGAVATITTNGVSFVQNLSFSSGAYTLGSALSTAGTISQSGPASASSFNSANYSIASSTFSFYGAASFGTSAYTVILPSSAQAILSGSVTGGNFTFNLNTSSTSGSLLGLGASVSSVVIGGTGSSTTFYFLGADGITNYTNNWGAVSSTKAVPHTVLFAEPDIFSIGGPPFTQHNFTNFNLSGLFGNQLILGYYTAGSGAAAKLVQTSGIVSVSYDSISNLNVSGGASWRAYTRNGNFNAGGNTGWSFAFPVSTSGALSGAGSSLSGIAVHQTVFIHATSGTLSGPGTLIAGVALNASFSLANPTLRYADFFRLTTASGVYLFSTAPFPITVPSVSASPFTALGQLIKVGGAQRDIKSTANETTITMVGIDTAMLGIVLAEKIKGSKIELWHGFFNSQNQLVTATGTGLYQYFSGYVNTFSISEEWMEDARSFAGAITISASSFQLILQNRTSGRYTNDAAWKAVNPTDTSMNRVNFISTINYAFGKTPT